MQQEVLANSRRQAYFVAWSSRLGVGALFLCFLSALVLSPEFRSFAFPPRPPKMSPVAPTLSPSEVAESEATAFADEVSQLAASPASEPPLAVEDLLDPPVEEEVKKEDKARASKLAKHGLPIQRFAGDLADGWERWANALSPTFPFPENEARIKVALHLLPIALALAVVPVGMLVHALTAVAGLAFFADPMLRLGIRLLDDHAASWREAIEIQQYAPLPPFLRNHLTTSAAPSSLASPPTPNSPSPSFAPPKQPALPYLPLPSLSLPSLLPLRFLHQFPHGAIPTPRSSARFRWRVRRIRVGRRSLRRS